MAPPKFDDLCKPAKDLLNDDYQVAVKAFKVKSKTNFTGWNDIVNSGGDSKDGATLTSEIDLGFGAKAGQATPTKLSWKFPKPLGLAGLAFDKVEMDKKGGKKLEMSVDKALHGVDNFKVECKSDLTSLDGVTLGGTYTGVANLLIKAETKPTDAANYTAEAGYSVGGGVSIGVKSTKASPIEAGAQYSNGPFFLSAFSKEKLSAFSFHGLYKVSDSLKLACTYDLNGKNNGQFAAGAGYNCCPGTSVKGKVTGSNQTDLAVSTSLKHELAKGVTATIGANIPTDPSKSWTFGALMNFE